MKKSLVLAMAMALGVTASAYAANNPFSDVPAGHWAYDSLAKLAAAGVIDGYGDSTFGGDKLMTRYEMAQITAKAMAKGANVDKLAAEFADELDNLGVRVANLEKKADNVKISGQIRYEYGHRSGDFVHPYNYNGVAKAAKDSVAKHRLRSRLYISGKINEDWSYTGRLENNQDLSNNAGDEKTYFNQAWVDGKLGGLKVVAGKTDLTLANGNIYDDTAEYIGLSYGKDVKVNAYYGKPITTEYNYNYDEILGISLSGKAGKLSLSAGYDIFKNSLGVSSATTCYTKEDEDNAIWNINASYAFDKNVKLNATYLNSNLDQGDIATTFNDVDTDGYVIGLAYKGANRNKVGSWGAWATYYDQGVGTVVAHTMKTGDWDLFATEGYKGYDLGANYTLAKNMVYNIDYYELEGKESGLKNKVLWSRLQINF
ncbi:MAG: S-layer homology domain-containing protein [Phascolarctobacterium sp.]|nr:S-layer homology domain-containing protein [Phascolarctobacterium sp.]